MDIIYLIVSAIISLYVGISIHDKFFQEDSFMYLFGFYVCMGIAAIIHMVLLAIYIYRGDNMVATHMAVRIANDTAIRNLNNLNSTSGTIDTTIACILYGIMLVCIVALVLLIIKYYR